jgi:hypothetical protein
MNSGTIKDLGFLLLATHKLELNTHPLKNGQDYEVVLSVACDRGTDTIFIHSKPFSLATDDLSEHLTQIIDGALRVLASKGAGPPVVEKEWLEE